MKQIIKRITGWLLVLAMITSMLGQYTPSTYAETANDTPLESTPGMSFQIRYVTGGSSANGTGGIGSSSGNSDSNSENKQNIALLGRGKDNAITVNLVADLKNGQGKATGVFFELKLPVLRVKDNGFAEQLSEEEVEKLTEEDFENDPGLVRVMASFVADGVNDLQWGYNSDEVYWGEKVRIENKASIQGGTETIVQAKLWFEGKMPENEAAIVKFGGGYSEFEFNDKKYVGFYQSAANQRDEKAIFTMICCNLEWETKIEAVNPKNVLWDKWNYVTYKVTFKNVSKDDDSKFDASDVQVIAPTNMGTVEGWESGLHPEEGAKYLYNDGNPVYNDKWADNEVREQLMVGVPGKGGIMIYDVTELDSTEEGQAILKSWNLTDFDNIKDASGEKVEELPYYFKPDGGIYFKQEGTIYNENGSKSHKDSTGYDHVTYYISIPMATDIPADKIDTLNIKSYNTVTFGSDYTWTKTIAHNTHGFLKTNESLTGKKYVIEKDDIDGKDVDVEKDEIQIAINDSESYYLGHFKNTGNIPVFNAMAVDTIDKDFVVEKMSVIFNNSTAKLTDWFESDEALEFEFKIYDNLDGTGEPNTDFVNLGKLVADDTLSDSSHKAWSYEYATQMDDYIAKMAAEGKLCEYTGRFRFKFKKRIEPEEEFDGQIKIYGTATKGKKYSNKLDTIYEKWIANPLYINYTGDDCYYKNPRQNDTDEATIKAAVANPKVKAEVIKISDNEYERKDPMEVPVNASGYGVIFQLGNDSVSRLQPGQFSTNNLLTMNSTTGTLKGLVTEKIVLSKRLIDDVAKIGKITLTTNNETDGTVDNIEVSLNDFKQDKDGNYYLEKSAWETKGKLVDLVIEIKKFAEKIEINSDNEDIYIALEGYANIFTPNPNTGNEKPDKIKEYGLVISGKFETKYNDAELDVEHTDNARLWVRNINPVIKGYSYGREYLRKDSDYVQSLENYADGSKTQTVINSVEVPNGIENSGYKFFVSNKTVSSSGNAEISIDLSSSVSNKTSPDINVRGYKTNKITIKNYEKVVNIKQIKLYNQDKNPSTDTADVIIPFESLKIKDDTIVIDITGYSDIEYLKYVVIDLNDFLGGTIKDTPEMEIDINGFTDWYGDLDAKLTFTPEDKILQGNGIISNSDNTKGKVSLTNRLAIEKPYATIHADVHYYELDGTTKDNSDNRDKNDKYLGIPYDRDFTYTIDVTNKYKAKLDDFELKIELPINNNKQGDESNTGFHTTGIRISKELIEEYDSIENIIFYDVDSSTAHKFLLDYKNGQLISEDGSLTIAGIRDNDDVYISEEKIYSDMNIHNLKKIIINGKGFAATPDEIEDNLHRITVYGFSDSNPVMTENKLEVNGNNYLCGFRKYSEFTFNTKDTARAYISKMYFDTTLVAGYKDNTSVAKTSRFDEICDSWENVRYEHVWNHSSWSDHFTNDDSELDIGYKAIGSYMLDFRQYLNAGANYPCDDTTVKKEDYHHELSCMIKKSQADDCTAYDYYYTQSMNTAADVTMTVNIPSDSFDTYYMKVHPKAYEYVDFVEIYRKDGTSYKVSNEEWKASTEKVSGSNDTYYRVDLRLLDDGNTGIYVSPTAEYKTNNPVTKVVIKLNINRNASRNVNGKEKANNADYGTWYDFNDESTKYMFEVTGRFYKTGIADASATTQLDIGQLCDRPYAKAKKRTDVGKFNSSNDINDAYRSAWSYQDYWSYPCWKNNWHYDFYNYKSAHLYSTAKVYVHPENNHVLKGVHEKTDTDTDTLAKFGKYNEYSIGFRQYQEGGPNDCCGISNYWYTEQYQNAIKDDNATYKIHNSGHGGGSSSSSAINNDPDDWSGKHAFTDKVVLTDTLPYIRPDSGTGYFGFLTKKIYISNDIKQYIDNIVIYKKKSILNADGSCTNTNLTEKITIKGEDLVKENTSSKPAAITGSDQDVVHTTKDRIFYEISVEYDTTGENADAGIYKDGTIVLAKDEYITKYEIHMSNLPGDVDYAAELEEYSKANKLLDSYNHGTLDIRDIYVGGEIYRVTEDNIKTSGTENDWNTITAASYTQHSKDSYFTRTDNALITSYRIPFQGGFSVTRDTSSNIIYDYMSDNLTPTTAKFNVRIWNKQDENKEDKRSAEISTATATNTMDADYRLKHIYIPTEFIKGNWFKVQYIKIGNNQINLSDLMSSPYFKEDGTSYVFDVNAYIKDGIEKNASSYSTFKPNNTKKNSSTYYKEYISSFVIKFSSVGNAGENALKGGEFLNDKKGAESLSSGTTRANATPTYSYDGVYVDRNIEDIKKNAWTYDSTPTIINNPNEYTKRDAYDNNYNYLSIKFTTYERDYTWGYGQINNNSLSDSPNSHDSGTETYDYYHVYNRVATALVNMERTTDISTENATSVSTYAYDKDGDNNVAVDKTHVLPDDYIEYQITVKADDNSLLPLYHPDVRFVAPKGQRIVGWYILENSNTSSIPNEDITANATDSNKNVKISKNSIYCKDSNGDVTNYKQLDISCGDLSKAYADSKEITKYDKYNQLLKGEQIKLVVITQMTTEISTFEGKIVNEDEKARIYITAHPKHTFSQYKMKNVYGGNSNTGNSENSWYWTDSSENAKYYRDYGTGFYGGTYNNEKTYYTNIRSTVPFFNSTLDLTLKYVDGYTGADKTSDTNPHIDERPMILEVRGAGKTDVTNNTLHELSSATFTVSFISENNNYDRLFKGFDLLEKPTFMYPSNMDITGKKQAKVWYCFYKDKTSGEIIHTSTNSYNAVTGGYDEVTGMYDKGKFEEVWIEEDKVIENDSLSEKQKSEGYQLVKDAVKIKWTYENIPKYDGSETNPIVFATTSEPFEFHGIGRYRDIRKDSVKNIDAVDDNFEIGVSAVAEYAHSHNENIENTDENGTVTNTTYEEEFTVHEYGSTTKNIIRERPIVTVHTQTFEKEEDASSAYSADATQIKGYRPNDVVWYKDTVINNKYGQEHAQGALLNPVIFDKIPEYITASGFDSNNIKIKWYDKDNKLKENIPSYTITCTPFEDVADYGGDFVTTKENNDGVSLERGHAYEDLKFGKGGNSESTPIDYNVYAIQFEDGSRLEIGERIEIYYEVTIRNENLPLSYTKRKTTDTSTKTFVDYYPKMGEYYQWKWGWVDNYSHYDWNSYSYPYVNTIEQPNYETQFKNQNDMMDMNYLIHDVGVSGQRNKNIDRYEYLKDSMVYMPGSGRDDNNENRTDIYGSNNYLKDEDVRTANNQQKTFYVPVRKTNENINGELPGSETYRSGSINGKARDWYNLLMKYRVRSTNWQSYKDGKSTHVDAVIWAESRLHLQTGWIAAGSEMIGDKTSTHSDDAASPYLKSHEYLYTNYIGNDTTIFDNHYDSVLWDKHDTCHNNVNEYTKELNDDVIETLEYDQYFTSRISAYNYGDWDITSGVEFTYIMPQGIEPKLDKDGNPDFSSLKSYILSSGTSKASKYTEIDSDDMVIEVLQKPGDENPEYKTPNIMRDPVLSTKVMNKTGDSYENESAYYDTDEQTSWVLKITVKKALCKWFNRGTNSGYIMYVDIPSHVYATPEDEYWYDEVMVKPVDTKDQDSLYYQVYDTTSLWGNTDVLNRNMKISSQRGGMDYLRSPQYCHWHVDSSYWDVNGHVDTNILFFNGSPNTAYINGMNISNNEVSAQGKISDSTSGDRSEFSTGIRNTYASTGTRAHMRKPLIRTWTTVGENNIGGSKTEDYYVNPQGENGTLNIHVENKYWLQTLAPNYLGYYWQSCHSTYEEYETYKVRHTYSTDGGNMGTLYHPVVTQILPAGIVPKDTDGKLFTKDNDANAKKTLDWTLRGANYSSDGNKLGGFKVEEDEKELYQAVVEYIELEGENGKTEGRYKITFKQKEEADIRNEKKAKINSESAKVFSFKFFTVDDPDVSTKNNITDDRLADQYQSTYTFVSSEVENYKFILDSEVDKATDENPYWVGSRVVDSYIKTYSPHDQYHWEGTLTDTRRDKAVERKETDNKYPLVKDWMYIKQSGILPDVNTANNLGTNSAINATDVLGNKRYYEKNGQIQVNGKQLEMEDYTSIRESLHISSEDANMDNGHDTSNSGAFTSARIRLKYPVIENKTFVSDSMAQTIDKLGARSPQWQNGKYQYYPSADKPVEYMDELYYNVKIVNGADKVKSDEYWYHGDISHGKLKVTVVLPSIVRSVPLDGENLISDRIYLIYKKADGTCVNMNIDQAKSLGWQIEVIQNYVNDEKQQVVVLEICTSGDYCDDVTLPTYQDYVDGKHLPGYFGYKDTIVVGIKTKVRNNVKENTTIDYEDAKWGANSVWDENFKADGYVTIDDVSGFYLKDKNPDGNFDLLTELDDIGIQYERMVVDNEEKGIDYDMDEDYEDRYAKDVSAIVTLLKPHSTVRLDTSVQRAEIQNPDLGEGGQNVVDDPTVKSAVKMSIYMDQAVNEGSAVREFIVDWRIPFKSTLNRTDEEAPVTEDGITKRIYAIGTGVWEIPESAGDENYRNKLKEKLKVKIYAQLSDDTEDQTIGAAYENLDNVWENDWINLTELYNKNIAGTNDDGVSIDSNTIIDIEELGTKVYNDKYALSSTIYQLRYVISADEEEYVVPRGFRLDIDAVKDDPDDATTLGKQEMNDIDPDHYNMNPLPESVTSEHDENGKYTKDSRIGNAAFVMMTASHLSPTRRHINDFATGWAKYDDTQYSVDSERSRAGYYISRELPVLEIDMKNYYYKIGRYNGEVLYKWEDNIVINSASHMLKYSISLKDLKNDEIVETNVGDVEEDTASNPEIVAVLPIIQNIDKSIENEDPLIYKSYKEVEYGEPEWEETLSPDHTGTLEFSDNEAVWSWHVEDSEGNVISKDEHEIRSVTLTMYDKIAGIQYLKNRRIMRWTSKGKLEPGQKIVIDYMLPISTEDTSIASVELLSCKAYGFKPGAFVPNITESQDNVNYAYEIDTRDVNDNGKSNTENTITVSLSNIGFSGTTAYNRIKRSFSEYGTGESALGNGRERPSLVPEGTHYSFTSSIINPDTMDLGGNKSFVQPIIYDVLPYVGDTQLVPSVGDQVSSRGTDWRGWLNLDTIQVVSTSQGDEKIMTDGKDVNIWIGPFNYENINDENSKIVKIPVENLPDTTKTGDASFYDTLRGEGSTELKNKKQYFVRLKSLLKLKETNKEYYEELEKHAQAFYVETKADYILGASTKLAVTYTLKAPLNLPLSKKYIPEDSENILSQAADSDGWNSFATSAGTEKAKESPYAGVYLAAPYDRGYIGHYVWLDESYNAEFTDEAEYYQRDGRWILKQATKDLDYDGNVDDPGINGVKVELLTEKGYTSNRNGEAVIEKDGRYILIDEGTGKIKTDSFGKPMYTEYGPLSYTTEKDVYGNDGYFIISNVKPGKYNLRYTFPEDSKYNKYAVTTRKIGITGTKVNVYRPNADNDTLPDLGNKGVGDEPNDGAKVKSLTVQTAQPIQIDAIGKDEATYAAYDEKMTSYDLGVGPSYAFGGYAWKDIQTDTNGEIITSSINGKMEASEEKLKNVGVNIYEVKSDGSYVPTYDMDGNEIKTVYTDEKGYFNTTLYPHRSYIIIADTTKVNDILKPTPVTISTRPLQYEPKDDNDLIYNATLNKNSTHVFAVNPNPTDYQAGKCVQGQYGTYDRLGLGFVPAGVGSIGKYVFDDENYDGIRNEYIDSDGYIVSEPGVDNVKLILEKYGYKDGEWKLLDGNYATTTSKGSSYTFIVDTAETDITAGEDGERYLLGYKVKVDMDTVPEGYAPTKYGVNNGISDSDLPLSSGKYRYLTNDIVIVSEEATATTLGEHIITVGDKSYDISNAKIITEYDAGLTKFKNNSISGKVWLDDNYNGILENDENGMKDQKVTVKRYYLDSVTDGKYNWIEDTDYVSPVEITDANGDYSFENLVSYVKKDNKYYLAAYKVFMAQKPDVSKYGVTLYGQYIQGVNRGSDLKETELTKSDDYIILASSCGNVTGAGITNGSLEASYRNELAYVTEYKGKYYDIVTADSYEQLDAGYVEYPMAYIEGNVFEDYNFDGIINGSDDGKTESFTAALKNALNGKKITVTAYAYYYDNGQWHKYVDNNGTQISYTDSIDALNTDGSYQIEVSTKATVNGKNYLAGYKVYLDMVPDGYHITRHKADGVVTDSNTLIRTGEGEYSVTKELASRPYAGTDMEVLNGYVITARPSTDTSSSNIILDYDIADGRDALGYNIGFVAHESGLIDGIAFEDKNNNGKYDEPVNNGSEESENDKTLNDESENVRENESENDNVSDSESTENIEDTVKNDKLLSGVKIGIKRYSYDDINDKWVLAPDDSAPGTDFYATTITDENGYYSFENLPTHKDTAKGPVLYGYTVWLLEMPTNAYGEKMAATYYQINGDKADSALVAGNMQVIKSSNSPKLDADELFDGNTMLINKTDADNERSDIAVGYDCTEGKNRESYNLGFVDYSKGSIEGCVFDDKNIDGIIDDADEMFENVEVGLKRYIYEDGKWMLEQNNADYIATTTTDADGNYIFDNLESYVIKDTKSYLYGYEVWVINTPNDHVITRYQSNNGTNDSAVLLNNNITKNDSTLNENFNGKLVVARKVTDEYKDSVDGVYVINGYDIVHEVHLKDYNAGYTILRKGEISGIAFNDANYNGKIDDDEKRLVGVKVGLKRFVYVEGEWILDEEIGSDENLNNNLTDGNNDALPDTESKNNELSERNTGFIETTITDENGHYEFANLDTHICEDGVNKLYGYEVWIIENPEGYSVTRYGSDSYVRTNGQIIKLDTSLAEMFDGKTVVAHKITENDNQDGIDETYEVLGYNVILAEILDDYNAGYTKKENKSISGLVWIDEDNNGICDINEKFAKDIEVVLERLYLVNGQWNVMDSEEFIAVKTAEDGTYRFDDLMMYGEIDGKKVIYGYKVKIPTLPKQYSVSLFHAAAEGNKNDLNEKTGYLELEESLIVLADKADKNTPVDYVVEGYNISHGMSVESLDAGITPYGVGSIAGYVFEDTNGNGKLNDEEEVFEGKKLILEYRDSSEGAEFEKYPKGQTKTDKNGYFKFENLPVLDQNNKPYEYRITMSKPDGYTFTKVYSFKNLGKEKANILYSDVDDKQEKSGITHTIKLAVSRKDKDNVYGLEYEMTGYEHINAYIGFKPMASDSVQTGYIRKYLLAFIPAILALMAIATVLVFGRRKKEDDE